MTQAALHSGFPRTEVLLSLGCPRALPDLSSQLLGSCGCAAQKTFMRSSVLSWALWLEPANGYNKMHIIIMGIMKSLGKKLWNIEIEIILSV